MSTPNTRSTKEIIVRDTYVTGSDEQELKKAESCLIFIDAATQNNEDIKSHIANLDHLGIGNAIRKFKPVIMSMGYPALYSHATALENEFLNQIIASPRPSLEGFLVEVEQAINQTNAQVQGMRVSLI